MRHVGIGALFYCKTIYLIFINMNRIVAFLIGYVAMCCAGIYCIVESFKKL